MAQTASVTEELSAMSREMRSRQHSATAARAELVETASGLKHEIVRLTPNDRHGSILRRDPHHSTGWNLERVRIGRKHGERDWGEPEPVVGLVTGFDGIDKGSLELIFVVPGDSDVYKINVENFNIEILDRFPDDE